MRKTGIRATICATSIVCAIFSVDVQAQTPGATRDRWGLTDAEWLLLTGGELRQIAGFPAKALQILSAAQAGDSKAAALMAGAYAVGVGVPIDPDKSLQWAKTAAAKNIAYANFALSRDYDEGRGTPVNKTEAQRFMKLAAEGGYAPAKVNYAWSLIENGANEGPDADAGRRIMQSAADAGQPQAIRTMDIWQWNDRFVEAARGMPLWKDGRGLLRGHGDIMMAQHPCRTFIGSAQYSGRWIIDWSQTRAYRGTKGELELVGVIRVVDINQSSRVFGFFEFEGASRNLERSRANFRQMREAGDELYARCSTAAADG